MNNAKFDVTAIGNAIVDVIAQADDALLAAHKLPVKCKFVSREQTLEVT